MTKKILKKKKQKIHDKNAITYHNKDVASKLTGESLVGQSLAPFGLPIIDYESTYTKENFVKYINYGARVIKRYAWQKKLDELKELRIIVIYTADVENACRIYDLKGITVKIEPSYLVGLDTGAIYRRLKGKLLAGEPLDAEERMQLTILPLTAKGLAAKQEAVISALSLAKQISDQRQKAEVLAGILTFSDKFIDENYRQKVKGALEMTQVEQMIFEEAFDKAWDKAWKKAWDEAWKKAWNEAWKKAAKLEASKAEFNSIKNLMETMKLTPEQAMNALKIPDKNRKKHMARLSKNRTI